MNVVEGKSTLPVSHGFSWSRATDFGFEITLTLSSVVTRSLRATDFGSENQLTSSSCLPWFPVVSRGVVVRLSDLKIRSLCLQWSPLVSGYGFRI